MPKKAKAKEAREINIIVDTREKQELSFNDDQYYKFAITREALKTGDYSIKGFESVFCIERKASTSELSTNFFEDRFEDVLQRLAAYPYKFILCEFTLRDVLSFPINSGIPKGRWRKLRVTGNYLHKRIVEIQVDYGIPVIYAGDHAAESAAAIIKKVYKDLNG